MKTELEEVAERLHPEEWDWREREIFKDGAKWQQERSYSEEEVLQLLLRLQQTEYYDNLYDWFKQFKKK